jgi:tRNA dimethylallyltransferase
LILFGPTASGKTGILEELFAATAYSPGVSPNPALAGEFPAEIVSADSMQVYRGMDIGTAKPSPELLARLPHHLINIRNPDEQFNVGEFVRLADRACEDISHRGKLPVLSGGTGFYLRNFVLGLPETPTSDLCIRETLKDELRRRGPASLMEELAVCDPVSAARIHINDEYRLLRALEIFRLSGRPRSSYSQTGAVLAGGDKPGFQTAASRPAYRFLLLGIERPREEVYRRINERCAWMFRSGLPEEIRLLHAAGYGPGDPGMKAIGYQEFFVRDGNPSPSEGSSGEGIPGAWHISTDMAGVETLVARNCRHYAKRQITFFASIPGVKWIPATGGFGEIRRELGEFLIPSFK